MLGHLVGFWEECVLEIIGNPNCISEILMNGIKRIIQDNSFFQPVNKTVLKIMKIILRNVKFAFIMERN